MIIDIASDVPSVMYGDEVKIRQVLMNLLTNALKFTENGCIRLHARRAEPDEIEAFRTPGYATPVFLHFSVKDTGIGFETAEIEQLFDPFSTMMAGKTGQRGSALDLAISLQFVRLMGGDLSVRSEPGKGTEFSFVIALGIEHSFQTEQAKSIQMAHLAPNQDIPRLLVVDNHQESRQWLVWLLTMMGFEVRQAASGSEALQVSRFFRPDLIFMDMEAPPGEGIAATHQIKTAGDPPLPLVIGLTSQAGPHEHEEMVNAGCDDILTRRLHPHEVTRILENRLGLKFITETVAERVVSGHLAAIYTQRAQFNLLSLAPEWVETYRQAVETADFDVIFGLIRQIRSQQPELCEYLSKLANNYDLRGLQSLLPKP
jgi:CheY-like chemotaxis protein